MWQYTMNSWFMIISNDSNSWNLELLYPVLIHHNSHHLKAVCVFVSSQNDAIDANEVTSL